jgi:membrane associated rhomboid family serine protease
MSTQSDRFSLFFVPDKHTETLSFSGGAIFFLLAAGQLFGVVGRLGRADYLDHLVGMMVGFFSARWWQNNGQKKDKPENPIRLGSWWNTLLGKGK